MGIQSVIRNKARKLGFDIVRFNLGKILDKQKIDVVLDVGANDGKYGLLLRGMNYKGKIISFEPLKSAYSKLEKRASHDNKWTTQNIALGNTNSSGEINVSKNSYSSSLLNMLPSHSDVDPNSQYISKESITIATLDSIIDSLNIKGQNIMLKIDTQGFEKSVLDGAINSIPYISVIQLEMSLTNLYENETLFTDMHLFLSGFGYKLIDIEQGFVDSVGGRVLQIDGLYSRN